jgi:hypothetical protein
MRERKEGKPFAGHFPLCVLFMPRQMAWANMQLMLHLAELWAIRLIHRILPERDGLMSTGTGAQCSDPKVGNPADFPTGHGPQGDAILKAVFCLDHQTASVCQ